MAAREGIRERQRNRTSHIGSRPVEDLLEKRRDGEVDPDERGRGPERVGCSALREEQDDEPDGDWDHADPAAEPREDPRKPLGPRRHARGDPLRDLAVDRLDRRALVGSAQEDECEDAPEKSNEEDARRNRGQTRGVRPRGTS